MENQRPAPFEGAKPYAQLLIFIGLTCISIFLLLIVMMLLQMTGKVNLMVLQSTGSFDDPDVLKTLKILQIISSILIFILPVVVFAFLASRKWAAYLNIDRIGKISVLLLGGILMVVASPLINFLQEINSHLQLPEWMHGIEAWMKDSEAKDDALTAAFLNHQTLTDLIVNLIMIALVAAVSEELFFRGVLQNILVKMTKNTHVGIWITGIIFSAIHLQFYGFLPRMLMGVYLGYLLVWSGSLWVTIFAHFINNGAAVLFSYLEERKVITDSVDKVGTQAGGSEVWYVVISTALVVLLLVAIYKISRKNAVPNDITHAS
ncbi:MAG TPA: CPBP family intramembrane glutamic endopeptidase [Bacteroidia bacterium]|nr:CPBP family intramembrane glutamic endopeptidase [Bacteroidia bacterium]